MKRKKRSKSSTGWIVNYKKSIKAANDEGIKEENEWKGLDKEDVEEDDQE